MPEPLKQSIVNGDVVIGLRKRFGWNQGELAARAGISQSVLSRLENGKPPYDFSVSHILAIANAFEVPVSHIIHDAHYRVQEPLPNMERTLEALIRRLATYDEDLQRQASFILEGYLLSLIYLQDNDNLKFIIGDDSQ